MKKASISLILAFLLLVPSIGSSQSVDTSDLINTEGIPELTAEANTDDVINIMKNVFIKAWDLSKQILSLINDWLEENFNISLLTLAQKLFGVVAAIVTAILELVKSLIY